MIEIPPGQQWRKFLQSTTGVTQFKKKLDEDQKVKQAFLKENNLTWAALNSDFYTNLKKNNQTKTQSGGSPVSGGSKPMPSTRQILMQDPRSKFLKFPITTPTIGDVREAKYEELIRGVQSTNKLQKGNIIPLPFSQSAIRQKAQVNKIGQMSAFIQELTLQDGKYKDNANFQWSPQLLTYVAKSKNIQKKINSLSKVQSRLKKNLLTSNQIFGAQASQEQIKANIPLMIQQLISANQQFSQAGFGPIGKNGRGLFAGRWIDTSTGRVRILPKATNKYLNPTSYNQKFQYLQARLINSWNKYQSAQIQLQQFMNVKPSQYKQKQQNKIMKGITQNKRIYKKTTQWMADQISLSQINAALLPRSSLIVIGTMNMQANNNAKNNFLTQLAKLNDPQRKQLPSAADLQNLNNTYLAPLMKNTLNQVQTTNVFLANKLRNIIITSYSVWANKGLGRATRSFINLAKTSLPDNVTEADLLALKQSVDIFKGMKYKVIRPLTSDEAKQKSATVRNGTFTQGIKQIQNLGAFDNFLQKPSEKLQIQYPTPKDSNLGMTKFLNSFK